MTVILEKYTTLPRLDVDTNSIDIYANVVQWSLFTLKSGCKKYGDDMILDAPACVRAYSRSSSPTFWIRRAYSMESYYQEYLWPNHIRIIGGEGIVVDWRRPECVVDEECTYDIVRCVTTAIAKGFQFRVPLKNKISMTVSRNYA
jgi:hypothetical protein